MYLYFLYTNMYLYYLFTLLKQFVCMYVCIYVCVCPFEFPPIQLSKGFPKRLYDLLCVLLEIDVQYPMVGIYINLNHFLYRVDIFTACPLHVHTVINYIVPKNRAIGLILIIWHWTVALVTGPVYIWDLCLSQGYLITSVFSM